MREAQKDRGLVRKVSLVVGTVVGSGVFLKAQSILALCGGQVWLGLLGWGLGALVMLIVATAFSILAKTGGGLSHWGRAFVGERYGAVLDLFFTELYYPALTGVLAQVSALFTLPLLGLGDRWLLPLSCLYLTLSFLMEQYVPHLLQWWQLGSTALKLVALLLLSILGIGCIILRGIPQISTPVPAPSLENLFSMVVASAFAYEGWVVAISPQGEAGARRDGRRSLLVGCLLIALLYLSYFLGLCGIAPSDTLIQEGTAGAFRRLLGAWGGTLLGGLILLSCLGTLASLTLVTLRGKRALTPKNRGVKGGHLGCYLPSYLWMLHFYLSTKTSYLGPFGFDSGEMPIITLYGLYLPILYRGWRTLHKSLSPLEHCILLLGILAACFMVLSALYAHGVLSCLVYLGLFGLALGTRAREKKKL